MNECKTKYPIILVHGAGFRDLDWPIYWGRIPKTLTKYGADIYYGLQDSWASTSVNASMLRERIDNILTETGSDKVNLIGHSKGGLEIRMVASSLGMQDKIASITTISTPHHGSKTVDKILKGPNNFFNIAAFAVNNWIRLFGDKNPDFLTVCREFSTEHMKEFNEANPDCEGIFYQSYGSVMRHPFSDINLSTANFIVNLIEGPNDGLVSINSSLWGTRHTVLSSANGRGISHLDVIDLRRTPFTKRRKEGHVSDITEVYIHMVAELKGKGL